MSDSSVMDPPPPGDDDNLLTPFPEPEEITVIEEPPVRPAGISALDRWIRSVNPHGEDHREYVDMNELRDMIGELEAEGNNIEEFTNALVERCQDRTYVDAMRVMNALLDIRNLRFPYDRVAA